MTRTPGLYEELVTRRLEAALEEIRGEGWRDEVANLDPAEAPGVLARFVHDLVEPLLGSLTGKEARSVRRVQQPVRSTFGIEPTCSADLQIGVSAASRNRLTPIWRSALQRAIPWSLQEAQSSSTWSRTSCPRSTARPSSTTTPSRLLPASSSPSSTRRSTGWGRAPPELAGHSWPAEVAPQTRHACQSSTPSNAP